MKIAIIVHHLDVNGGTQRQAVWLASTLSGRGHEVKLYTFRYSPEECYPELLKELEVVSLFVGKNSMPNWIRMRNVPVLKYLGTLFSIQRETKQARVLAGMIDHDTELLNPHDRVGHRVSYFFKKYARNIPSVWNMNDPHSMRWMADKLADVDPEFRQPLWKKKLYALRDWYENVRFVAGQDVIVVMDRFNQELVKKYFDRDAYIVRSGPGLEGARVTKRTLPGGGIRLLTSGIFFPHRRFEDAIEALRILLGSGYNVELDIVGNEHSSPRYSEKLRRIVYEKNLQSFVHFLGKVSEEDLDGCYRKDHIYLSPHHLQPVCFGVFEAMARGMPVVVATIGAREIFVHKKHAMIVNPKDPEDMSAAVKEIIDTPHLYEELSEQGLEYIRNNRSWEKYADEMHAVYQRVLHL